MSKEQWANGRSPIWYRVLKEFGFPTLVCIGLAAGLVYYYKTQTALAGQFLEVLTGIKTEQGKTNEQLKDLVDSHR